MAGEEQCEVGCQYTFCVLVLVCVNIAKYMSVYQSTCQYTEVHICIQDLHVSIPIYMYMSVAK